MKPPTIWWDDMTPDEQDEYIKEINKSSMIEMVPLGLPPKRLAFITASGTEVVLREKDILAVERYKDIELYTDKETWFYWVFISGKQFCTSSPLFAPYFEEPRP